MSSLCSLLELRFAMWGDARRRLRRQNMAACFLFLFFLLLLNTMPYSQVIPAGGQQLVHVREDSHSSQIIGGGGGGEHGQQQLSRLGSRPPFCASKCGGCAPCTAVQVPAAEGQLLRPQGANYVPVGWKCKCGAALFDP